jgi:type II secretory pathway predicted ATPase ExeA
MFTQFFGLKFNPFTKEISTDDIFQSSDMLELSARLKYLQNTRGIGLVVGESGAGKSTALRKYTNELNKALYKPCYFALSTLTVKDYYQALAQMLGEEPASRKIALFKQIQGAITSYYYEQKITPVIILDEIQMAPNDLLEDLRMIFNFSMDSQNPYILILAGQPHIRNKLALNINYALRQRITVKYILQGLKREEIENYITSRLKIAGVTDEIFSPVSYDAIFSITKGLPRNVNNIATACLICACAKKQHEVDDEIVYQANAEIEI